MDASSKGCEKVASRSTTTSSSRRRSDKTNSSTKEKQASAQSSPYNVIRLALDPALSDMGIGCSGGWA